MFSKLMDNTNKGTKVYCKRTICEVHREIYDVLVMELAISHPEVVRKVVPLLEESFIMGIKMASALIEKKLETIFDEDTDGPKAVKLRIERIRLIKLLEQNQPKPKE